MQSKLKTDLTTIAFDFHQEGSQCIQYNQEPDNDVQYCQHEKKQNEFCAHIKSRGFIFILTVMYTFAFV